MLVLDNYKDIDTNSEKYESTCIVTNFSIIKFVISWSKYLQI